jgi:site-specific recombinase XerD
MTALRDRMIGDMKLAGLSVRTQQAYTQAVKRLATFYRRRPDQLSEEDVRAFLVHEIDGGIARGTFKRVHFGLKFFFLTTLGRDWPLFSKKTASGCPSRSVSPRRSATTRFADCSAA